MKIAVIGSREYPYEKRGQIWRFMKGLPLDTELVSGGAEGVDTWAKLSAEHLGMPSPLIIVPDYRRHSRRTAPLRRNELIVDAVERVFAFWDGRSRGTIHACKYALRTHKPVFVYGVERPYREEEWAFMLEAVQCNARRGCVRQGM